MNQAYGLGEWPKTLQVDLQTLENVEAELYRRKRAEGRPPILACGPNLGPYFKGVELLLAPDGAPTLGPAQARMSDVPRPI